MGIEGPYLNIVKAIYDKPTANIILKGEKLKTLPLRSGTTQVCPLSPLYSTQFWKSQLWQSEKEKKNKRNPDGTRRSLKLSLFADDMILYIENPKDAIKKLLELINEYSKVTGCKINTQKSLAFLYTNNEKSE